MSKKEWKIEIIHDDSEQVVKTLEFSNKRMMEKAYKGLIQQIDLINYTACRIEPLDNEKERQEREALRREEIMLDDLTRHT